MHDEFRSTLARQGIGEAAYLKATGQTEAGPPRGVPAARRAPHQGAADADEDRRRGGHRRPRGGHRGAGRARAGRATRTPRRSATSSPSAAGTSSARTLRRTRLVETLVDRWLAAHPEHPAAAAPRGRRAVGARPARRRRPTPPSTPPTRARSRAPSTHLAATRRTTPMPADAPGPGREEAAVLTGPRLHHRPCTIPSSGGPRCSSRWSSSPPAVGSARTTSTRACSGSGSSSSATRSRTTSPT